MCRKAWEFESPLPHQLRSFGHSEFVNGSSIENRRSRIQTFNALRNHGFRWLWISGLGQSGAQGVRQFALPWLILDITGSLTQLGFVVLLQGLSMSLVALIGGILADRYDRRSLLIWSQAFTFLVFFALATSAVTGKIELWQIYGASFIGGGSLSISMPARQALIRSLVPRDQIMNAVALNSLQMTSSMIIWPSVAGFMIQFIGMGPTLYANAVCLVIGIWGVLMMGQVRDNELDQSPPRVHRMLILSLIHI